VQICKGRDIRINTDVVPCLRKLNPCQAVLLDGIDFSLDVVPEADGDTGLELVVCKGLCEYRVVGDVAIVIFGRNRVLLLAELHLDGMFAAFRSWTYKPKAIDVDVELFPMLFVKFNRLLVFGRR
jgi:hypothetical protein